MKTTIKIISILIAVLLVVSLASGGIIGEKVARIKGQLEEQKSSIEGQLSGLGSQLAGLKEKLEELKTAKAALEAAEAELEKSKAALENENAALENEIKEIEEGNAALETGNTALESENAALETGNAKLESEKSALEGEKAALETEKSELMELNSGLKAEREDLEAEIAANQIIINCFDSKHVWDGESEIEYVWSQDFLGCYAYFTCMHCKGYVVHQAQSITETEEGVYLADFGDVVPDNVGKKIIFSGVSFNSDSQSYDEATNTFTVSEDTPFVLTFSGKNLDLISADKDLYIGAYFTTYGWHAADRVYSSEYVISEITEGKITVTLTREALIEYLSTFNGQFELIEGIGLFDIASGLLVDGTKILVNVKPS